jgi:hypothetical protein
MYLIRTEGNPQGLQEVKMRSILIWLPRGGTDLGRGEGIEREVRCNTLRTHLHGILCKQKKWRRDPTEESLTKRHFCLKINSLISDLDNSDRSTIRFAAILRYGRVGTSGMYRVGGLVKPQESRLNISGNRKISYPWKDLQTLSVDVPVT